MNDFKFLAIFGVFTLSPFAALADGQGVPINYDNLSFFEEPLAAEIGPATINANILLDQAAQYNTTSEDDTYNTRVIGEVKLEAELPNSVQVGVQYFADYDRLADNEEYTDNIAVFLSDEWGTLAGGNVTGSVRENTRRTRGFGNADLANDDFVGELDETGGFYSVRYNSYEVSLAADQEGRAEAGVSFERPIGKSVYFASVRARKGDTTESSANDIAVNDDDDDDINVRVDGETYGGAVVGKYTYASFLIDGQLGYEVIDKNNAGDNDDHVFGSIGTQYKYGAYRVSAEGSLGRYDGEDRRAFALGSRIDVARGMSLNFGVNYTYANDDDDTTGIASVRYEL